VEEEASPYCWLFLEDAAGEEYSVTAGMHRRLAGHWLGLVHAALGSFAAVAPMPDRGPGHYGQCLRALRARLGEHIAGYAPNTMEFVLLESLGSQCAILEGCWDRLEHVCADMPWTIVHGDFSYKNLRVRAEPGGATLLVYDWETAGRGVPAVDLARSPLPAPHFTAEPDLATYWETVRDHWPGTDLAKIEQWANLGTLFRCIAAITWDIRSLERGSPHKLLKRAGFYQAVLAHTLRAVAWVG
jgi:hypothetical protein